MWYEDDIREETDDFGGRRRRRRKLVCKCVEVGGERDCGCGRGQEQDFEHDHHDCESGGQEQHKDHCKGCICEQLKDLQTFTRVRISTSGVAPTDFSEDLNFIKFDKKDCCAHFRIGADDVLVIDCRKIKALRLFL